jgi:molecular chaperone DnaK (HSP70)
METTTTATTTVVVVGIDIGSESTKIVLGARRGCEIVRNDVGGHTTPTAVSFSNGNLRHIGATAQTKNAVLGLTRLLAGERCSNNNENNSSSSSSNDALVFGKFEIDHNNIVQGISDYESSSSFSASALLAMLMGKIQSDVQSTLARIMDDHSNNTPLEFNITIPPETSEKAKQELLDAAYAAGLSRARLVESSRAYQSCYQRKFPEVVAVEHDQVEQDNNDKTILVVDMGKTQTTVVVLGHKTCLANDGDGNDDDGDGDKPPQDEKKTEEAKEEANGDEKEKSSKTTTPSTTSSFQVLSAVRHKTLGAGSVDLRLWDHFQTTVPALKNLGDNKQSRAGQRLLAGAKKLKHLLSQLSEGEVTVENVGEHDSDLKLSCTRKTLAELCQPDDAAALTSLIRRALKEAGRDDDDDTEEHKNTTTTTTTIELTGGGCRIPWVKETIVRAVVGGTEAMLAHSLDDTSAALGAALWGEEVRDKNNNKEEEDKEEDGGCLLESTETRRALRAAEEAMARSDRDMQAKADVMNQMEAHVLELRSAKHDGKHASLIPAELDGYLDDVENWLFSEAADGATKDEMEAKWNETLTTTNEMAKDYLEAKRKEQAAKDAEMEAQAKQAQAEDAAADDDNNNDNTEDHDNRRLPKKRRMEIVMKNKAEANELFGDGNHKFAAARYTKALSHCAKFVDLSPNDVTEVNAVKLSLNLNLALAYLKLENPDQALRVCNEALTIDDKSSKALFRRASVYYEKKQWDLANKDAKVAIKIVPDDKALKRLQKKIDAQLERQKLIEKKMAQKMFG